MLWKALTATGELEVIPDHLGDNQLFSLEHVTCRMNEQQGSGPNCLFALLGSLLTDTCSVVSDPVSCHFSWLLSSWQTGAGWALDYWEEGKIRKAYCTITFKWKTRFQIYQSCLESGASPPGTASCPAGQNRFVFSTPAPAHCASQRHLR